MIHIFASFENSVDVRFFRLFCYKNCSFVIFHFFISTLNSSLYISTIIICKNEIILKSILINVNVSTTKSKLLNSSSVMTFILFKNVVNVLKLMQSFRISIKMRMKLFSNVMSCRLKLKISKKSIRICRM